MPVSIQPAFSRGELSTALYGRVDTAAYRVGLRTAWNIICHVHGGASNRGGLEFVGPAKFHDRICRLIPFKFKNTDTYMLEFGDLYMRVIRGDAHVTEGTKAVTGATQTNPVVITAVGHGYTNGGEVQLANLGGMLELNGRRVIVANVASNTFEIQDQATSVNIDGTAFTTYTSGGTAARIFEVVTPWPTSALRVLKYTQSADVMTLTHPDFDTREVNRFDHDNWTVAEIVYLPSQDEPLNLTAVQNGTPGTTLIKYKVTALADETFEESLPALNDTALTITGATQTDPVVITATAHGFTDVDEVKVLGVVGMTEINGRHFTIDNKTANTFELRGEDGAPHGAYISGGTATQALTEVTDGNATLTAINNITLTWDAIPGAQRYAIYKENQGLFGLLGETETATFVDDGTKAEDLDSTPPKIREPFRGVDNRAGAAGYFQQRRVLGGSNNKPDTHDFSRTADQSNFTFSVPLRPDDAIRATLTGLEVNVIKHYIPLDHLIVLTTGEEWRIDSGDVNRFSADTIRQTPQTSWGCGDLTPVKVGRIVLFGENNDSVIRSIGYSLAVDGYTGTDLTLLASHLFRDLPLVDWGGFVKFPDPIIYGVRSDGIGTTFTFSPEQEVTAWTRIGTRFPDTLESVGAVRPTNHGNTTDGGAYFVVKRNLVNSNTVRYIEHIHERRQPDVRDAFYVDSGLTYDIPIAVSAVSLTDPVQLTIATGHGLVAGDEVDADDIIWVPTLDEFDTPEQPKQLNGGRFKVITATATTITLEEQDGTDVDASAFNAYSSGGNVRKAVSTILGFHHLAGQGDVIALCDGSVVRDLSVSSTGAVVLPRAFSRVHLGFGYYSDWELLDLDTEKTPNTIQDQLIRVSKVNLKVERSRGLWIGPDAKNLTEWKQKDDEDYGTPIPLFTGDVHVDIPPLWNDHGRVYMRQRDPLPMTILSVIPIFETEESDT